MPGELRQIIAAEDPYRRDIALDAWCRGATTSQMLEECRDLDEFRRHCDNLYLRVRALFFLYALHRYHLPSRLALARDLIPFAGHQHLLNRRFEEALDLFLRAQETGGPSGALSSALAAAYRELGFQTLANQVRRSVRSTTGNQWMFRMGHPLDHPLRIRPELLQRHEDGSYPILVESTPVRMDLTHSAWSDIFFLGMDAPESARVLNVSIDLSVLGRDSAPSPPVDAYLRVIDEPVIRLVSVDLGASADVETIPEMFDFGRDYLGLIKAALVASGIVPPGLEGSGQHLRDVLRRLIGPGLGLEAVSHVHSIPKGSRLAVSTNLLASLIALCMRATRQAQALTGSLTEEERRLVAARAILGEWLGGSGGGWQDSGGVWPGIKLIAGEPAREGDPEYGVSRGRLLPRHVLLSEPEVSSRTRTALQESLILVHGGMAQNVGPILEMVTEKYLLRSQAEWSARAEALSLLDEIRRALRGADMRALGRATTRNFTGPIQTIIPWASNAYTEALIAAAHDEFGEAFWGFWMLGGMSGGGMGFIVAPDRKPKAQAFLQEAMSALRAEFQRALPFAIEPVVYDFRVNEEGTVARLLSGPAALMPPDYYSLLVPHWIRRDPRDLSRLMRADMDRFAAACRCHPELSSAMSAVFDRLFPEGGGQVAGPSLQHLLDANGFDREQHETVRSEMRHGRIGLAQNRLPVNIEVADVADGDVADLREATDDGCRAAGEGALSEGAVAVLTLAAGAGSRWTQGAGTVKALHPFCKFGGRHRTFVETHLAKSRRTGRRYGTFPAHLFSTSYATHDATAAYLDRRENAGYDGPLYLSPGRSVGLRMVPMLRDLQYAWSEQPQKLLEEQAQKMRESQQAALLEWARRSGEGSDYTDNLPHQCLHPVGHWYEVPNLMRNGVLRRVLAERPQTRYLLLHNIDTVGVGLDPALLGLHILNGACLSFEVIPRHVDDRGGGLARVNGRVRILEGLAMPHESDECALSFYNSMTTWIDIDQLLGVFGLVRRDLAHEPTVAAAIRRLSARIPTYITLKEVKKRWGHGQEDVYPVAQWEKLWSDITLLPEVTCRYFQVSRWRGQQLKEPSQLDGWLRDGSADYVDQLCDWAVD